MEMGAEAVVIKQEIKEEDEVCFELISVKEERVLDETEQEESCHLDTIDSQSCFVADGIKEENDIEQEYSSDTELNENVEFEEKEINCDWFEPPLNEPDPLAIAEIEGTGGAVNFEADVSSNSSNRIGSSRLTENNCGDKNYKSAYSSALTRHETHSLTHQLITNTADKPFICNICDYSSNHRSNLKSHILTHTKEKPFKCDMCFYSCNRLSSVKRHKLSQHPEKKFKCDSCDYSCNNSLDLKTHSLAHPKEKQFKCNICDYSSNKLSFLNTHKLLKHIDKKPYKCNICDYSCNRPSGLKSHSVIHTKEKLFKCDMCFYSCNRPYHLKCHKLTQHPYVKEI